MLLQLSVENFKSIHEQVIFSMSATKDELHENYKRVHNDYRVLPSSIIMGTNGAGKSNLFLAIKYLQLLLKEDNKDIPVYPHLLSEDNKPTQIDVQFIIDERRIVYGIDVLYNQVVSEFLYIFDHNKQIIIFEREDENYQFNPLYEDKFNNINKKYGSQSNLFLSILSQFSDVSIIYQTYLFLTKNIKVLLSIPTEEESLFHQSIDTFKDLDNQNLIQQLMTKLDIGIIGFEYKKDELMIKYENMEINLLEESTGTKKLFTLLVILSEALNEGKVVLIDELEKHLHHALVQYFINLFNDVKINNKNAQLIFSTHDSSLLDLNQFRRDQIWFMEKNLKTMSTVCYSLYNIKDVKLTEDVKKGYILGKYGATYHFKHGGVIKDEK